MEENELIPVDNNPVEYTDDNIRHLSDMEHVRTRPGMMPTKFRYWRDWRQSGSVRVCTSVSWATVRIPKTEFMSF